MTQFEVETRRREEMVDVTRRVQEAVSAEGLSDGWVLVFSPHTTSGVTINENADPDVVIDLLAGLRSIAPEGTGWRHREGNADAHVKATLTGSSVTVPVSGGQLVLGTWQAVFFCEYDGPRHRKLHVTTVGR
jgi:secondary thiamine-phosphate synthase enzyme